MIVCANLAAESCRTLQDKPKALHYKENAVRFARFADKIIHLPLGTDPEEKVCPLCHTLACLLNHWKQATRRAFAVKQISACQQVCY